MVLPIFNDGVPETKKWKRWIIGTFCASIIFGGTWWFVSRDAEKSLIALAMPWAILTFFIIVALIWSVTLIPLMFLMERFKGRKKKA